MGQGVTPGAAASDTAAAWPGDQLEAVTVCPVCRAERRTALYAGLTDRYFRCAPGAWTLFRCAACRTGYLDPRPTAESIGQAYTAYHTHEPPRLPPAGPLLAGRALQMRALENGYLNHRYSYALTPARRLGCFVLPLMPVRRVRLEQTIRWLRRPPGGRLLDVGCGNGQFLLEMRTRGWEVCGLEVDGAAVRAARQAGLDVHQGPLEEATFSGERFDAVTLRHVIEHLHDPVAVLRQCRRILRPGGMLWIAAPNILSLGHRIYGRDWVHLDPPRHLILFTPASLRRVCREAGFEVRAAYGTPAADFAFTRSWKLARGEDPLQGPFRPDKHLARRIRCANILGVLVPALSEEITLLAR